MLSIDRGDFPEVPTGFPSPTGRVPTDLAYWIALHRIEGLRSGPLWRLIRAFGDLSLAWTAPRAELERAGLTADVAAAVVAGRAGTDPVEARADLEAEGATAVAWHDPAYPAQLREIPDPPPLLYVRGNLAAAEFERTIAIVGTRRMSDYGRQVTRQLGQALAQAGICVVSGMAAGIDTAAHRAALDAGGTTVAVWGTPLDLVYPASNRGLARQIVERGAILTEYPLGTSTMTENFATRNRIISGLARGTLVVEAPLDSGALITARYALEQNREIMAVPGDVLRAASQGANRLLFRGEARAVSTAEEVLEALKLEASALQLELPQLARPTAEESVLLEHLSAAPVHIDALTRAAGMPAHRISAILTIMEIKGLAQHLGGGTYVAARTTGPAASAKLG